MLVLHGAPPPAADASSVIAQYVAYVASGGRQPPSAGCAAVGMLLDNCSNTASTATCHPTPAPPAAAGPVSRAAARHPRAAGALDQEASAACGPCAGIAGLHHAAMELSRVPSRRRWTTTLWPSSKRPGRANADDCRGRRRRASAAGCEVTSCAEGAAAARAREGRLCSVGAALPRAIGSRRREWLPVRLAPILLPDAAARQAHQSDPWSATGGVAAGLAPSVARDGSDGHDDSEDGAHGAVEPTLSTAHPTPQLQRPSKAAVVAAVARPGQARLRRQRRPAWRAWAWMRRRSSCYSERRRLRARRRALPCSEARSRSRAVDRSRCDACARAGPPAGLGRPVGLWAASAIDGRCVTRCGVAAAQGEGGTTIPRACPSEREKANGSQPTDVQ